MRICYFGIYSAGAVYPRNNNIIKGLREAGVIVDECRVELEESHADRAAVVKSRMRMIRFGLGLLMSYVRLFSRLRGLPRPDVLVVGHPGYFHLHFLKIIRALYYRGVPLVYDVYIPLYDAVVCDRKMFKENSLPAKLLHWFEGSVCRNADLCLIDTYEHCRYLEKEFKVPWEDLGRVFVGSSDVLFPPAKSIPKGMPLTVLQFGTYIPLHGLHTIVRAAKLLENDSGLRFVLVGGGQLEHEIRALAKELEVKNVEFREFVPVEDLHKVIASAHICLGLFGATEKAQRVIASKSFDTVAVGRPLISGETPAMKETFVHGENVYFVPVEDPPALARAITALKDDPGLRERIAKGGRRLYEDIFTPRALGEQFLEEVEKHFGLRLDRQA